MKKSGPQKDQPRQQHSFQSKLERIASGMEYYALSIPASVTRALGTRGPVPVSAQVNGSQPFLASLYPVGGGRHYLRVRNKICKSVGIGEGDRVKVRFKVRDRSAEIAIPKDLMSALRAKKAAADFDSIPMGRKSYLLRLIGEAVKPETRAKRIQAAVEEALRRKNKPSDRREKSAK